MTERRAALSYGQYVGKRTLTALPLAASALVILNRGVREQELDLKVIGFVLLGYAAGSVVFGALAWRTSLSGLIWEYANSGRKVSEGSGDLGNRLVVSTGFQGGWGALHMVGALGLALLALNWSWGPFVAGILVASVFIWAGVRLILLHGLVCADPVGLSLECRLGRYAIRWDEIERFETDFAEHYWVIRGNGKRIPLFPLSWSGHDRGALNRLLARRFAEIAAPRSVSTLTPYWLPQG